MTLSQATEIVKKYNSWRLGKIDDLEFTSHEITVALNVLLKHAEKECTCPRMDEVEKINDLYICKKCGEPVVI